MRSLTQRGRASMVGRRRSVCEMRVPGAADLERDVGDAFAHVADHAGASGDDAGDGVPGRAFEVVGLGAESVPGR